ncbi:hypothetical protein ACFLS1_10540 [Verrucomicrobiota bacterium]
MRKAFALLLIAITLVGCGRKPDIPETKCLVFTTMNNHRVTTWVNDEPVLVCDNVWNGYNKPFWLTLRKGQNKVHFTVDRLPSEITKVIGEHDPSNPNDGSTTVKIIKGGIFSPEDMIVWKTKADSEKSPYWTVHSDTAWRPSLEPYDPITAINDGTKKEIQDCLNKIQKGLDSKDLSAIGFIESDVEFLMQEIGITCSVEKDIFGLKEYEAVVSPLTELNIVSGKKTIMVYRPDGEAVFYAGLPEVAERESGKMYYHISGDALYFVKEDGKLKPLWIKEY